MALHIRQGPGRGVIERCSPPSSLHPPALRPGSPADGQIGLEKDPPASRQVPYLSRRGYCTLPFSCHCDRRVPLDFSVAPVPVAGPLLMIFLQPRPGRLACFSSHLHCGAVRCTYTTLHATLVPRTVLESAGEQCGRREGSRRRPGANAAAHPSLSNPMPRPGCPLLRQPESCDAYRPAPGSLLARPSENHLSGRVQT